MTKPAFVPLPLAPHLLPTDERRNEAGPAPWRTGAHDRRSDTLTQDRPTQVERLALAIVMKKDNVFFVADLDGTVPGGEPTGRRLVVAADRRLQQKRS